jgi:putative oxidoreductase
MEGYGIPGLLLYPTIALEIILPLFIIFGYQARLSASLLAIFCLATAFIFHYDFADQMQTIAFLKNIGIAGGFLFIVANGTKDWAIETKKKYVRL